MRERKETESYLWGKLLMGDMGWAQEDLNVGDLLEQPMNEHVQLYGLFGELAQRLKSAWDCVSQAPEETAKGHGVRKEVVLTLNGKAPDEVSEVVKTKRMQSNQKVTNQLCAGKYVLIDMQARIT
jgi:hypothetical protein